MSKNIVTLILVFTCATVAMIIPPSFCYLFGFASGAGILTFHIT